MYVVLAASSRSRVVASLFHLSSVDYLVLWPGAHTYKVERSRCMHLGCLCVPRILPYGRGALRMYLRTQQQKRTLFSAR